MIRKAESRTVEVRLKDVALDGVLSLSDEARAAEGFERYLLSP